MEHQLHRRFSNTFARGRVFAALGSEEIMKAAILLGVLLIVLPLSSISQTPNTAIVEKNGVSNSDNKQQKTDTQASATPEMTATPAPKNDYVRPNAKTRFRRYAMGMFGPMALGKDVLNAGWSTWRNSPEEWGDHWEGFGRRFASSVGKGIIKNTVSYGLDESFKLDSHYYRSKDKSTGARIKNALISPVTARNRNGDRVFGFPRLVGTYTASIVAAETWYPARYNYKDGLKNGTISLGLEAAFNLVKEFIWKK